MSSPVYHVPVLLPEILHHLPSSCQVCIDGTLGHGGHTQAIYDHLHHQTHDFHIYGLDRDQHMIDKAIGQLGDRVRSLTLLHTSYHTIYERICKHTLPQADMILLDLGVNNDHFVEYQRGFSLQYMGPLDMRFDTSQSLTAYDIIHTYSATQLTDMCVRYGEFTPYQVSACIDRIVHMRATQDIKTTTDLKDICLSSHIPFHKIAVFFQALRIEVNQEMKYLELFLANMMHCLASKGRCMVITYHSIEDRIVKYAFLDHVRQHKAVLINKKVIKPSYQEQQINKKSRSAKLRIIQAL